MNTTINGSAGMGQDTTMAPSGAYGNDSWASISPYSQSPYGNSPMNEYSNFSSYMPHGMPSESLSRMPPPPPQHPPHQPHQPQQPQQPQQHHQLIQPAPPMGHQQLPMLNTTWPSQLTNPTPSSGSYSAPPLSVAPISASTVEAPRLPMQHEKARKTLSVEQKRAMCQYHEENPGTRQADIGARFGVERSTVSKVLRHKDQYLKREQEPEHASVKRGKGKHPDFDRTLSNYVRRQQQSGFDVKDEEIMEQARLFAHASGNQETLLGSLTSSWLQKFKQKHGIGAGRLMRRASEANIPDSARMSTAVRDTKRDKVGRGNSPGSPGRQLSPLSGSRSDEDVHTDGFDYEFSYRQAGSQSTTSLTSELRDNATSSFSAGAMSPAPSFNFSPDPNVGAFPMDPNMQLRSGQPPDFSHREKRSNTFPSLNIDYVNQPQGSQPQTPRNLSSATAPSSALESPANELQAAPFAIDTTLTSPPILHRSSSNSSITGRSNTVPVANNAISTPVDSSPVSPTPEDARRAANTLLNYIQSMSSNGHFDQSEYMAVVQLTKKLQIHQHQAVRSSLGGLSRIPEGDGETVNSISGTMESR